MMMESFFLAIGYHISINQRLIKFRREIPRHRRQGIFVYENTSYSPHKAGHRSLTALPEPADCALLFSLCVMAVPACPLGLYFPLRQAVYMRGAPRISWHGVSLPFEFGGEAVHGWRLPLSRLRQWL